MKRAVIAAIVAVVSLAGAAWAHDKHGGGRVTVRGCLAKGESGGFKLTNASGGSADDYQLLGGKSLSSHVGHKVEVTGKVVSSEKEGRARGEKESASKESAERGGEPRLRVKSMRHIATTCP